MTETAQAAVEAARAALLSKFRWDQGHADVWRVFADPQALAAIVEGLAAPWRSAGVTHVLGLEARGFLLGGAVAVSLGAGFHAVRKTDGMLPGPKLSTVSAPDYRGRSHTLRMQGTLGRSHVGLLVDDWAERGAQALAARDLVERTGAQFAGLSLMVDQLSDEMRTRLGRVTALVRASDLGEAHGT